MNNLTIEPKTTVIIDGSVVLHALTYTLNGVDPDYHTGVVKAQATWLMSLAWMTYLKPTNYNIVIVQDQKRGREYWRHSYLKQPHIWEPLKAQRYEGKKPSKKQIGEILYKGGRKLPDASFKQLKATFYKMCKERGWNLLSYSDKSVLGFPAVGYEADDCAAAICHINNQRKHPNRIWLATIDADWLGLVNDHTHWICTSNHTPRVRIGLEGVNEWASHRLKTTFNHPTDLWHYKSVNGDVSDNLPPVSPIEVIDLFNPPDDKKVWLKPGMNEEVNRILDDEPPKVSDHLRASQYLRQLGVKRVIPNIEPPLAA